MELQSAQALPIVEKIYSRAEIQLISKLPTLKRIEAIIRLNPGLGGVGCGAISSVATKAQVLKSNKFFGCCSDFNEVFGLLAVATGVYSREINTGLHTFSEVWVPETREWVHVDPQFGVMAIDGQSKSGFSSVFILRKNILKGDSVKFKKFKNESERSSEDLAVLISRYYIDKDSWRAVSIVEATGVVSQSQYLSTAGKSSKIIIHAIGHLTGYLPGYEYVTVN